MNAQVQKSVAPDSRAKKPQDQNQPTGEPGYIVNRQTNVAQHSVSTPVKKKNKKRLFARKAKSQNKGNVNAYPSPPSPNDAVSYGVTASEKKENTKRNRKQKSSKTSKASGADNLSHDYGVKEPRPESKKGGNVKAGLPASQRGAKSAEQNQPTGEPDYIVQRQTNEAQKTVATPEKNKNDKSIRKEKSKQANVARTDAAPYPPSPNDAVSYGTTAPQKQPNYKQDRKRKSAETQNERGNELLEKQYNIKAPRPEAKKDPIASNGVPIDSRQQKSAAATGYTGNLEPKSTGIPNNSSTDLVIPKNPKTRADVTYQTNHTGNLEPKSTGLPNNSSTDMVIPVNPKTRADVTNQTNFQGNIEPRSSGYPDVSATAITHGEVAMTKAERKARTTEQTKSTGDLTPYEKQKGNAFDAAITTPMYPSPSREDLGIRQQELTQNTGDVDIKVAFRRNFIESEIGIASGAYTGEIDYKKLSEIREKRKAANKEMTSNTGDIAGVYEKMKKTRKEKAEEVRDYRGKLDYSILAKRQEHEKEADREMFSNTGDIAGVYEKMKKTEKEKAIQVREYRGTYNYDILKDRKELRKQKEEEIAKNTGDIVGSYVDMRNRWKEQNKKIENYRGKIDYDVLKKQKDRMIALDKEIYSNTGDILTVSLEKKKSRLKEKSRKATWYEGDMIVTKRTKSNHPSAVYIEARDSKSVEAKEKMRKKLLKRSRHHRDKEDPSYMKKETPRPRYDVREYEIWESKTREGDGFSGDIKDK